MPKRILIAVFLFIVYSLWFMVAYAQESVTITTYYPSPYGVYKNLRIYPNDDSTPGAACTNEGEMYYDQSDHALYICSGTTLNWTAVGGGGGGSQNVFTTIDVPSGTDPVADSPTDTLTLSVGSGITLTGNSGTDTITIGSNTTYLQRRVAGSCTTSQAVRVINADGTVSCVNLPPSAICTYQTKTYSTGAICMLAMYNCGYSGCDYRAQQCQINGSWSAPFDPGYGTPWCGS